MSYEEQRAYVRGLYDGQMNYYVGDDQYNSIVEGYSDCIDTLKLTDTMMTEAITDHYKAKPRDWQLPPSVVFSDVIGRGACLDFINVARRKKGLTQWVPPKAN